MKDLNNYYDLTFDCPNCYTVQGIDLESLPKRAIDDLDYECKDCGHKFLIGWYAEVEVR